MVGLATKVDDKTFEIGVEKGTTQAQIKAIASNPDEYVSIKGNTGVQGENIYTNCSLADKEIPIKVTAMFDGEIDQEKDNRVPLWERMNLTLEEAAAYTGIGTDKLRELSNRESCDFVLWVGTKRLLKRKQLEEFLIKSFSI